LQEELNSIAEYLSKVDAREQSKEEARVSTLIAANRVRPCLRGEGRRPSPAGGVH
jgi:hypothetical protein